MTLLHSCVGRTDRSLNEENITNYSIYVHQICSTHYSKLWKHGKTSHPRVTAKVGVCLFNSRVREINRSVLYGRECKQIKGVMHKFYVHVLEDADHAYINTAE